MNKIKVSANKLREVLGVIETIASLNNEKEDNVVLNDIYKIAHCFAGHCENPHNDWREDYEQKVKELEDY